VVEVTHQEALEQTQAQRNALMDEVALSRAALSKLERYCAELEAAVAALQPKREPEAPPVAKPPKKRKVTV
jgi:hypothetical protein